MRKHFLFILFLPFYAAAASADVVVRLDVRQQTSADDVFLRLFDADAPLTVANFLNYANDGYYNGSFFHRSISNFVFQGGGFTFDPALNDGSFSNDPLLNNFPGGLQRVPTNPPVVNEFGLSNLRGTVAMAKLSGDPDSATSQWFVNLADNSANLDNQNGGFTVFGEVMQNGMDVIDAAAAQPVYNRTDIHSAFDTLPLVGFSSDPVQESNLIRINTAEQLFSVTPNIEYGSVTPGSNLQPEVIIKNTGTRNLTIESIGELNPVADPFKLVRGECTNILAPGEECTLILIFNPEASGDYSDSFDIAFQSPSISYEVGLHGVGGPVADEPDIVISFSSINFGNVDLLYPDSGTPYTLSMYTQNIGNLPLALDSFDITGTDASDFALSGDCLNTSTLATDGFCTLTVEFSPYTSGEKSADLVISSNDPDESPFILPMRGSAAGEDDGVDDQVENAGPNNGDGNGDGLLDSKQSNVVSLVNLRNSYVTYVGSSGIRFKGMRVHSQSDYPGIARDMDSSGGIYDFITENVAPGGIAEIGLILPANEIPVAFHIYAPTADDPSLTWHDFDFDGSTGAIMIGAGSLTTSAGSSINRNFMELRIQDGGPGDADLTLDGTITVVGGAVVTNADGGSGAFNPAWLLSVLIVKLMRCHHRRKNKIDTNREPVK